MATPLSEERIADMREFWAGHEDGDVSDDRAVWRFVHHASLDLLDEVDRLRGVVEFDRALADVADRLRGDLHECCKGLKNCDAEVTRLRARNAELEEQNGRLRAMVDNVVGQTAGTLMRAQDAERRIAERQGSHEWRRH